MLFRSPGDIVGAIANEAGIPGKAIGSIDIYDRFTFVEVPARFRDQILERMARSTLRGRPVAVRLATPERGPRVEGRQERPRPSPPGAGPGAFRGERRRPGPTSRPPRPRRSS